jgi:hypothetical protein
VADGVEVAAFVVSCVSLVAAGGSVWYARTQARHAGEAVVAAEEAARSAARSADVDEQTLALARLGRHHELGPGLPSVLDAVLVDGNQCMPLVTAREYAVTVTVIAAGRRIVFPLNRIGPRRVSVRLDSHEPDVWRGERVEVDLWPTATWRCGCGLPENVGAVPHWRHVINRGYDSLTAREAAS